MAPQWSDQETRNILCLCNADNYTSLWWYIVYLDSADDTYNSGYSDPMSGVPSSLAALCRNRTQMHREGRLFIEWSSLHGVRTRMPNT